MKIINARKHHMDMVFALALFCVFAVTAFLLVIIGGNVYQTTVESMEKNYAVRTSLAYLTEKIRQSDEDGAFSIEEENGTDVFIISQEANDVVYNTYMYLYDGYICELVVKEGSDVNLGSGQELFEADAFEIENIEDNLYLISIECPDQESVDIYVSTVCSQ